ncbi:MAG TPA: hypothetical protein PKI59_03195 [Candidatus Cloacimonadota bacterium]|nr:hypothetical protein [Candidatus Cloacimonadota bacterium]
MKRMLFMLIMIAMVFALAATEFLVKDVPWDDGKELQISWNLLQTPDSVKISRLDSLGIWNVINQSYEPSGTFLDPDLIHYQIYYYQITAYMDAHERVLQASSQPTEQWFYLHKLAYLIMLLMVSIAILYYIMSARRGKEYFIRRIAGLDSMEEAIGRATEKGKPILFVPGISDLDDIQTIASLTILSHLAQRSAEYDTELIVPCRFSMVLSAAREVVKEAYLKVGKPDAYKADNVFYLTDDQFGYVAGIDGIMLREQPAANFFLGSFYAESLILAETGYSTGAIQTAGTAQAHQLPFFVVSCDYTLIGEELFAASAYLSKDPQQLGSLKGHDFGKLIVIILIIVGVILEIAGISMVKDFISRALS